MFLLNVLRRYRSKKESGDDRLLRIAIRADRLTRNAGVFKKTFPHHALAAVLKSNAYGHGLVTMGRFWNTKNEIDRLVVDSIVEAELLRDNGVKKPIIILGHVPFARVVGLAALKPVVLSITSLEQAWRLASIVRFPLTVHVKVDTGMHRQGVFVEELERVLTLFERSKFIRVEGLLSHLADADGADGVYTSAQIARWREAVGIFRRHVRDGVLHFSATAGTRYLSDASSTMIRAGIGLYGFDNTQDHRLDVAPALSYYAKIVSAKNILRGARVGYNATFRADRDMGIAVVSCGYAEGVPRALSNVGCFYRGAVALPIVGRVSMNMTTVDVSALPMPVRIEDEVEIFSDDPAKENSIVSIARACGTIPYEILVRLPSLARREII